MGPHLQPAIIGLHPTRSENGSYSQPLPTSNEDWVTAAVFWVVKALPFDVTHVNSYTKLSTKNDTTRNIVNDSSIAVNMETEALK